MLHQHSRVQTKMRLERSSRKQQLNSQPNSPNLTAETAAETELQATEWFGKINVSPFEDIHGTESLDRHDAILQSSLEPAEGPRLSSKNHPEVCIKE
jgi:hypothetical protein